MNLVIGCFGLKEDAMAKFDFTERRRSNLAKILINLGTAIFVTLVIRNFTPDTTFNLTNFALWTVVCTTCFVFAVMVEE